MVLLFYIFFGLAPSIIWLLFYLRKDAHPEPNRMVLTVFFLGALAALLAAFLEMAFSEITKRLTFPPGLYITLINTFIGVALIEEVLKYSVVRLYVLKSPEFDEPVDAMLYMIIAALGFAALENILLFWFQQKPFGLVETFTWSGIRFLGATFLHALCSGLVGYFLALSFFKRKKQRNEKTRGLTSAGLFLAGLLHGLYNFSIIKIEGNQKLVVPVIILVSLAVFISFGFKKLKRPKTNT